MLVWLSDPLRFPLPGRALTEPSGLLCAGGELSVASITTAYRQGIFPWFSDCQPILWWSPDPRMVLTPAQLHVPRSLGKRIRQSPFEVRFNTAFRQVIEACAQPRDEEGGTWIVPEMIEAYVSLHDAGIAHSAEAWRDGELVGGLYGVALGRVFFGESMFALESDASKIAFVALMQKLTAEGFALVDCQQETHHLARFGAAPIPREDFLQRLRELINSNETTSAWKARV